MSLLLTPEVIKRKITPLRTWEEKLKLLVYGDSGVGKTVLACTAPKALVLDAEHGLASAAVRGLECDVLPINSWEEIQSAYMFLKNADHDYESVVIDSLHVVQSMCIRAAVELAVTKSKHEHDAEIPEIQDWNRVTIRMERLVESFVRLDMHVIMTCLAMPGDVGRVLALKGRIAPYTIPAFFDMVGYMCVVQPEGSDRPERRLIVHTVGGTDAKNRYLPVERGYLVNPTIPDIIKEVIEKDETAVGLQ